MYFKGDVRTSSVLCFATPHLGMALSFAQPDKLLLKVGSERLELDLSRQLHINNRVYYGGMGDKDNITFVHNGIYYNRADIQCTPFTSQGESAPAESRLEVSCVGDVINVASLFNMKLDSDVAVAVIRLKGGEPVAEGDAVYYQKGAERIYVYPMHGGFIELNGDELIVKQPIMNVSGDDCSVGLRFTAASGLLITSPPLAVCVEARRGDKTLRTELDRAHSVYTVNDENGGGDVKLYLENPFDEPVCMPILYTRRSASPIGAVLKSGMMQTGIPVQISCERIFRQNGSVSYYDFIFAPIIEPGARVEYDLCFIQNTACHLWTHGSEAQLSRCELTMNGAAAVVDLTRSLKGGSLPCLMGEGQSRPISADLLRLYKDEGRVELSRVRLAELYCGEYEVCAAHQACTLDRRLNISLRTSMIKTSDYTRLFIKIMLDVNADIDFDEVTLLSFDGVNFYTGDETSVSYIYPVPGEGLRFTKELSTDGFVGFDSVGAVLRAASAKTVAKLYACEQGESFARVKICLDKKQLYMGEHLEFELVLCLLPKSQKEGITDGQLMRRESAANKVTTVAIVGDGNQETAVKDDTAEVIQRGGLGGAVVRFSKVKSPNGRTVVLDNGYKLPVQTMLDRDHTYKIIAYFEKPEKLGERRYLLR